ncbi:MAG: hypothetical protein EOO39_14865 [Cytophagaceae bacterium]|nr:MAG: hypothetical protein EOO39_14865 [Cytophagaceae bacterium]
MCKFSFLVFARVSAITLVSALVLSASAAHAQKALDFTGGNVNTLGGFMYGWSFNVISASVSVDGLGIWDESSNGLVNDHAIGLWNAAGTLLTSTTVMNANSSASSSTSSAGRWLFTDIPPLSLQTGNYTVGALYATGGDEWRDSTVNSTVTGITYVERLYSTGSTFRRPTTQNGGGTSGYFGPNFRLGSGTVVPEANTVILLGFALPMIGAVVVARRKEKAWLFLRRSNAPTFNERG